LKQDRQIYAHLTFIIYDCDDKLATIEAKTGKARAKERADLAFSLLMKRIISSKKEKLWEKK